MDMLPEDYDDPVLTHDDIPDGRVRLAELAKDLATSITFTLSGSGYKNIIRTRALSSNDITVEIDDNGEVMNGYAKLNTKIISDHLFKAIFDFDGLRSDVHIYYDIGLDVRPNSLNLQYSFLPSLHDSNALIKNIMQLHNNTRVKYEKLDAIRIAYTLLHGVNSSLDSSSDTIEDIEEMEDQLDLLDYLSWGTNYNTRKYNIFFLTEYGNWHTGNSKTQRKKRKITCKDTNIPFEYVYLEHKKDGGICGAQMYCPISRKIQLKETRKATQYLDALASVVANVLKHIGAFLTKSINFEYLRH